MSNPKHLLLVLLSFLAQSGGADDKPSAKPSDARRAALVKAGYTAIPLTLGPQGLWFVDGTVRTEKVRFLLDSGGGNTKLDLAVAKRLKLTLGAEGTTTGLGGRWTGRQMRFPPISFGNYNMFKDWHWFEGLAGDLSELGGKPTGVLGLELMDKWASVVDYPSRSLYLRPPLRTAWPRYAGTWTVTSWQGEGQTRPLGPNASPTFAFADHRLKISDNGNIIEYGVRLLPLDKEADLLILYDPKEEGIVDPEPLAAGLIKIAGGKMIACLALDAKKIKRLPTEFAAPKGSGLVLLEMKSTVPGARQAKLADPLRDLLTRQGYTVIPMEIGPYGKRIVTARIGRYALRLVVDTGMNASIFDSTGFDKWGVKRFGEVEGRFVGGRAKTEEASLRGLKIGEYDTRMAWAAVNGGGVDFSGVNKVLAEQKLPLIQGILGNEDLLNGSAVIDFGTNTLYLRPIKKTLWSQLEGKWVGMAWESDGQKGQYKPGDAAVEFKDGRIRFTAAGNTAEWGFHLYDQCDKYRVGLFDPKADEMADGFKYASGGLLKLSGGKLTLVMEQGQARKEPTEFAAPAGSGLLLVEYERAK